MESENKMNKDTKKILFKNYSLIVYMLYFSFNLFLFSFLSYCMFESKFNQILVILVCGQTLNIIMSGKDYIFSCLKMKDKNKEIIKKLEED